MSQEVLIPPPTNETPAAHNCCKEVRKQYKIALPMMIASLLQSLFPICSLMFVGHLGELQLSGASLGNSFFIVSGFTIMLGFGSGLETLCGQAYGSKQYPMMGVYLQAAFIVLSIVALPLSILWLNMAAVFTMFGQDKDVSAVAGKYMKWLIPSLFANAFLQPLLKFMQSRSLVLPATLSCLFALLIHIPLCYIFIYKVGMGISGGALALSSTYWFNFLFLMLYIVRSEASKGTWKGCSKEALAAIVPYLKVALPSALMLCLEFWSFEILILLAGLLPDPRLHTSLLAICVNTETIQYMLPFGLSAAASTRVANEIGARNAQAAKFSAKVVLRVSAIQSGIVALIFLLIKNLWGWAFSNDKEIVFAVARMMPLLAVSIFLDGIQGVISGVARGCGWQQLGVYVNLLAFYAFGLPVGYILAFVLKLESQGLWLGLTCGLCLQSCILIIITLKTNWEKVILQVCV